MTNVQQWLKCLLSWFVKKRESFVDDQIRKSWESYELEKYTKDYRKRMLRGRR